MPFGWLQTQYQAKTEAPQGAFPPIQTFESAWHQPWSEPVRFKMLPAMAVVLAAASGAFAPVFSPTILPGATYTPWYAPLSEPVRTAPRLQTGLNPDFVYGDQKPVVTFSYYNWLTEPVRQKPGLGAHLQQFDPYQVPVQPQSNRLIQWFAPLSEPVRVKPRLQVGLNPFLFYQPEFPEAMDVPWFAWLSEPVRLPVGLKAWLQQTTAWEPRLLPPANVFVTMNALETNNDVALFGIQVYSSSAPAGGVASANVSIAEVPVENNASASLRES